MDREQLFSQFKDKAELVSAEVHRVASPAQAMSLLKEQYAQFGQRYEGALKTTVFYPSWLTREDLTEAITAGGGEILANVFEDGDQALIGIAGADGAIAETGTLFLDATDVYLRLTITLPLIAVFFVKTGTLLPDLGLALGLFASAMPEYLNFITGPSRTADIERVLTIGVHGPERLIVIFVDEEGGKSG